MGNLPKEAGIPRHFVFVLPDGTYVVQWTEARVQDLLTGEQREAVSTVLGLGQPISDSELAELKHAGYIAEFDRSYVWLAALDETPGEVAAHPPVKNSGRDRIRSYYLNTTLPGNEIERVEELLRAKGVMESYSLDIYNDLVIVLNGDGEAFTDLTKVEAAQARLVANAPDVFGGSAVAFVETVVNDGDNVARSLQGGQKSVVDVTSADIAVIRGKRALVVGGEEAERARIARLLSDMRLEVEQSDAAVNALLLLEDMRPELIVMDLHLSDMHGWEMLSKIREIHSLRQCAVIVLDDADASKDNEMLALTVAKVDFYLIKPVSDAQLHESVMAALLKKKQGL